MRARVAASAALAAVAALVLAGCNFLAPQATLTPYDPSDGVSVRLGDLHVLNAIVLSEDGVNGNLILTVVNTSDDDVTLSAQYEAGGDKTTLQLVAAPGRTDFGGWGDSEQLFLEGIDTAPGGLLPVYFQYGGEQGRQVKVPVLDGTLVQYDPLLPQTPTPEPTETPEPEPTETPAS